MAAQVNLVPGSPAGGVDETPSFRGFLRNEFMSSEALPGLLVRWDSCNSPLRGVPKFSAGTKSPPHMNLKWGTPMGEGTVCELQGSRSCCLETNPV